MKQILHDALFFIEKCDAKIQFCRIIGLVGIFSKNKIEYRPLPKISLLVHANWWECINTVMLWWLYINSLRARLHGGGKPQVDEVTSFGGVTACPYNLSF